ncbi:MAG: hypothetical protein V8T48_02820 [Oscillospiraceae bacterium]
MDELITYRSETDLEGAYKRGMRSMAVMKALFNQCKGKMVTDRRGAGILQRPEGLHHHRSGPDGDYVSGAEHGEDVLHLGRRCASGETVMGERYAEFYPDESWLRDFVVKSSASRRNDRKQSCPAEQAGRIGQLTGTAG